MVWFVTHGTDWLMVDHLCRCMDGSSTVLRCRRCSAPWLGTTLLIGTMYSYDVFAATPCCAARLYCKQCRQPVVDDTSPTPLPPLKYFSEYSRRVKCQRCNVDDYHFVKPLDEVYDLTAVRAQQHQLGGSMPRIWSEESCVHSNDWLFRACRFAIWINWFRYKMQPFDSYLSQLP